MPAYTLLSPASACESASEIPIQRKQTTRLPWHGLVTEVQRETLSQLFGDAILVPDTRILRFDEDGKICIPGSAISSAESKRTLAVWFNKSKDAEHVWWSQHLEKIGATPIKICDLLNGLDRSTWKEYKKIHSRELHRQRNKRRIEKGRKEMAEQAARKRQDKKESAVDALLALNTFD